MLAGTALDGDLGTDSLTSIENVIGSLGDDFIAANDVANEINGGDGTDTLYYAGAESDYTISAPNAAIGGYTITRNAVPTDIDIVRNIENVIFLGGAGSPPAGAEAAGGSVTLAAVGILGDAGTAGTDDLLGGEGGDTLNGGAGDDFGEGGDGNDSIDGGTGDDELAGGDGNDTLFGGDDDDVIIGGSGLGDDSYDGGSGIDTVRYTSVASAFSVTANLTTGIATGSQIGTDTLSGFENLIGGQGADLITGNTQANNLLGEAGADQIFGEVGNDTLEGGSGNDSLFGGADNDFLFGDSDDDVLHGGAGDDVLDGGANALGGGDTADYADATGTGVTVNLAIAGGQAVGGGLGTDTLSGIENVIGSALGDQLTGDGNVNTLTGGGGVDTMSGGDGNDVIYGDDGDDAISGDGGADFMYGGLGDDRFVVDTYAGEAVVEFSGQGTDVVYAMIDYAVGLNIEQIILVEGSAAVNAGGGEDNNVIIGNTAANVIYAYGGDDVLAGGDGDDSLLGMDGNDAIDGQGGNDQMIGGIGNDSFVINSISDVAAEFNGITEGIDTVYAHIDYTLGGSIEQLILVEGTAAVNGAGDSNDNVVIGNSAANTLYGNDGGDTLYGFANDDVLVGGNGNDIIDSGTGNDNISGNADADLFKFAAGDGFDLVNDFSAAEGDQLVISSALAADLAAFIAAGTTVSGSAVYSFGGGTQTITLSGVAHDSLVAADVIFF